MSRITDLIARQEPPRLIVRGTTSGNALSMQPDAATDVVALTLSAGTTQTIGQFFAWGNAGTKITLTSTSTTAATISQATGSVNCNFLTLNYVNATGGAVFFAGGSSTITNGSTGWILRDNSGVFPIFG